MHFSGLLQVPQQYMLLPTALLHEFIIHDWFNWWDYYVYLNNKISTCFVTDLTMLSIDW